mmetsp:Transcript_30286/g.97630  ORF Transcript_30286/g.97630 Transcript_30286/m.97630 type:complete len:269 (+) Transcript_30286:511-1317(+)
MEVGARGLREADDDDEVHGVKVEAPGRGLEGHEHRRRRLVLPLFELLREVQPRRFELLGPPRGRLLQGGAPRLFSQTPLRQDPAARGAFFFFFFGRSRLVVFPAEEAVVEGGHGVAGIIIFVLLFGVFFAPEEVAEGGGHFDDGVARGFREEDERGLGPGLLEDLGDGLGADGEGGLLFQVEDFVGDDRRHDDGPRRGFAAEKDFFFRPEDGNAVRLPEPPVGIVAGGQFVQGVPRGPGSGRRGADELQVAAAVRFEEQVQHGGRGIL